ncbi:Co-chaperone [Linderina pennispora]|nr:Co-chaperone [Linderina pennispora]
MGDWRNIGNWHWKEKNCFDWAKKHFEETLPLVEVSKDGFTAKVDSVTSVTGDVDLNIRKGRLITIYDVEVKLAWTATRGDETLSGKITIPEVAHDTEEDEYVYEITAENMASALLPLKDFVRRQLTPAITKRLVTFTDDLKAANGSEMYIPEKDGSSGASTPTVNAELARDFKQGKVGSGDVGVAKANDGLISTVTVTQSVEFVCSAEDMFANLTDPQRVSVWTRAAAEISATEGAEYKLFGGHIQGKITKVVPSKSIEETWRVATWPAGHYSKVVITLEQLSSSTRLTLKQTGVPFNEEDATKANWERYYWNSMKGAFG